MKAEHLRAVTIKAGTVVIVNGLPLYAPSEIDLLTTRASIKELISAGVAYDEDEDEDRP